MDWPRPITLHFTSPIRRYADLVVHRGLAERDESKQRTRIDVGQLGTLAQHISATERNAAEAEIEAVRMKKLEFFQRQLDTRNPQIFRASDCRCPQLRANGGIAGRLDHRAHSCLIAHG